MKKPSLLLAHLRHTLPYRVARWLAKVGWYGFAVVAGIVALVYVSARIALPLLAERKVQLEDFLTRQSGHTVRIDRLEAYWDGLHPAFHARGLRVEGAAGAAVVELQDLRVSPKMWPLFLGRLEIRSLILGQPKLTLERLRDGRFRVSGLDPIELEQESANAGNFISWLFSQRLIAVERGELQWVDRRTGDSLQLTEVDLELQNDGARHRLGLRARFPEGVCDSCSIVADMIGNPFAGEAFAGDLYARGRNIDLAKLPAIVRQRLLPADAGGVFFLELWSRWSASRPVRVEGEVAVADLRLPLPRLRRPLAIRHAATRVGWASAGADFQLQLRDLMLDVDGTPWLVGGVELLRRKEEAMLRVQSFDLADATALAASADLAPEAGDAPAGFLNIWRTLRPVGEARNVQVRLLGRPGAWRDFLVAAELVDLEAQPYGHWPGGSGVRAQVTVGREAGEVVLDVRNGSLALPHVFRAPLPIAKGSASVRWQREDDHWWVASEDIVVSNEDADAEGRMRLTIPHAPEARAQLIVESSLRNGDLTHAERYYPVHHLSPSRVEWMEHAFEAGRVPSAEMRYEGPALEFPFGEGTQFTVRAEVRDGVYRFARVGEPMRQTAASLLVQGRHFVVTGRGRVRGLTVDRLLADGDGEQVKVKANISGALAETLAVLRDTTEADVGWLPDNLGIQGEGALGLDISFAAGRDAHVLGDYRIRRGSVRAGDAALEASHIEGILRFTHEGVYDGELDASLLGGKTSVRVTKGERPGETVLQASGAVTAQGIVPLLGARVAAHVAGSAPWRATLSMTDAGRRLDAQMDLSGVRLTLPPPLDWPSGKDATLNVRADVRPGRDASVSLAAGDFLRGRLWFAQQPRWRLATGHVLWNPSSLPVTQDADSPATKGMHLQLRFDEVNLDRWRSFGGDGASGSFAWLGRISVETNGFVWFGRRFGPIALDVARSGDGWSGNIAGETVAGSVRYAASPTVVELDLARVLVPPKIDGEKADQSDTDPRTLPRVAISAQSVFIKDKHLEHLEFAARPFAQGWEIEKFSISHGETRVTASGQWRYEKGRSTSRFAVRLKSDDFGRTVTALGLPDQLQGGDVDLKGELGWDDEPTRPMYASMHGQLDLKARNGRFLGIKPGASRLFGILDLSAILRYLILDFSPVFGKGFAFESINGKMQIERGHAFTENLRMKSANARVHVNGRVGLATEDFNLTVDVYPNLSDSLTIGGLLAGGPQVALWTLLVNKLLKRQIDEGTRVTYYVRGPWKDPKVERETVEVPAQRPPGAPAR